MIYFSSIIHSLQGDSHSISDRQSSSLEKIVTAQKMKRSVNPESFVATLMLAETQLPEISEIYVGESRINLMVFANLDSNNGSMPSTCGHVTCVHTKDTSARQGGSPLVQFCVASLSNITNRLV